MDNEVREWFRRRTYRGADVDPDALVAAKQRTGDRISVVLPALNEERTVGEIVDRIRACLIEQVPLVDELVVIDSGSQDRTVAVARAAGATVLTAGSVLPAAAHGERNLA